MWEIRFSALCYLRSVLIILEPLFKLMPLESAQFGRRNRLATKREF
jgi:hypothetical protein